ncbi:unnamed protein product [Blepharisma stoltei]|uniref:Uncharacterized protein n=1 Tax=Blepharisma stoltei TaxID=1481888 RepID=A0AAU9KA48_9CILI|nr:unnamed protein product [Blepharisma stoltei]
MKIVLFCLIAIALAARYDIEETDEAFINPGGITYLEAKSEPKSGYIWYMISTTSEKIKIESPAGEYFPPTDESEAFGKLVFTIKCSNACREGEKFKVIGALQYSWQAAPFEVKEIEVTVTNQDLTRRL